MKGMFIRGRGRRKPVKKFTTHTMAYRYESAILHTEGAFIFLSVAFGIGLFILFLVWLRSIKRPNPAKLSAYECGFDMKGDIEIPFPSRFYLVAIFFIIFDVEIVLLLPWVFAFDALGWQGVCWAFGLLSLLGVGFFFEYRRGALEWE
jgi:NADH-quinone oxidoreductase subunit A